MDHTAAWERFEDSKLVGNYAEECVCRYFEDAGFAMTRVGVEHLFTGWVEVLQQDEYADPRLRTEKREINSFEEQRKLVTLIRCLPDFVAIRRVPRADGVREIFPVEVKYRRERRFGEGSRQLVTVRLSDRSVGLYRRFWPATLLVVVCHDARDMIATRVGRMNRVPDSRVPIADHAGRRSWFYDVTRNRFTPLWAFQSGDFDEALGRELAGEVADWADLVWAERHAEWETADAVAAAPKAK